MSGPPDVVKPGNSVDSPGPTVLNPSAARGRLSIRGLVQRFRAGTDRESMTALAETDLEIPDGQFVAVVGPTGCGKSTLLTAISGLRPPSEGAVYIGDDVVRGVRHDVGFVFQQDALLPWRTAVQNVALPLRVRGVRRREAERAARDWLARVGLSRFEKAYPHELSGGMRKRVAIAATLVYEPKVLLMDEPFSALDAQTRNIMENDLLRLWADAAHQTVVFVTHDLEEAIGLSDRVVVLSASPGRVIADYRVDLPRPRDLLKVKFAPGFTQLYRTIWSDLEREVVKANAFATEATEESTDAR